MTVLKAGDLVKFNGIWTGLLQAVYVNEGKPNDRLGRVVFVKHHPGTFEYVPLSQLEPATVGEVKHEKEMRLAAMERAMQRVG